MLALAGLLAATVMVSGVAVAGLGAVDARAKELYRHNILTTQAIAELQATLDDAAGSALQLLLSEGTADRSRLLADLQGRIVPRVDEKIAVLQKTYGADPDADPARLERLSEGWGDVKRLIRSGLDPRDEAQKQAMTRQVVATVDPISTLVAEMAATEVEHARESQEGAEATYRATRWRVLGIAATAALVWLVISLLLIRNIVPRVRAYSGFAAGVADGQPAGQLSVRGADELAELGHTLNAMVRRRGQERRYEESQAEFADTMQLSEAEREAHQLLKHHLERSIDGSQ
jgi:HAMP domain-containing protein